jgi:hypothetical protein
LFAVVGFVFGGDLLIFPRVFVVLELGAEIEKQEGGREGERTHEGEESKKKNGKANRKRQRIRAWRDRLLIASFVRNFD